MFKSLKDILNYIKLFQTYLGKRIYLVFIFSLLVALLEGFGILMLLPLLENLDSLGESEESNALSIAIFNFVNYLGLSDSTLSILILISVIFLFKGLFAFCAFAYNGMLMGRLLKGLKAQLFDSYSKMNFSYYTSKDSGHFTNLINEQPIRALNALQQLTIFGGQLINVIALMSLALIMAWEFGLMAVTAGMLMIYLFMALNNYVRNLSRMTANENSNLNNWIIQTLQSYKYLSATNQIKSLRKNVIHSIKKLTGFQVKTTIAAGFTQSVREPIAVIFIMLIIYIQIYIFNGTIEPIFVAIILFYRALTAALQVQSFFQGTYQYIGSMELINKEFKNLNLNRIEDGENDINELKKMITLQNISFSYDSSDDYQLKDISLNIPALSSVAFVGESGSGKSTILDVITLLNEPNLGNLIIDDLDSRSIKKESWRQMIGYVSQETIIFDATIGDNISMWSGDYKKNKEIESKIKEAAEKANILDFINNLPDGLDTNVGDRGVLLSGGQRQRLFIARELYKNPLVLILDEATSALDTSSERAIQQSIESLKGYITVIQVAHRLSTIKNVDLIYVLKNGKLIEKGTYKDLTKDQDSNFSKMIELQSLSDS
tara:strand:- start:31033 stop:32844 length:1812 start_codon:yes stop_codon:yes gene_type:complete